MTTEEETAFRQAIRVCRRESPSSGIALIAAADGATDEQLAQVAEDVFTVVRFKGETFDGCFHLGILIPTEWTQEGFEDRDRLEAILRQEMGGAAPN